MERAFFHFCRGDLITFVDWALTLFMQAKGSVYKRNKYALTNCVIWCKKKTAIHTRSLYQGTRKNNGSVVNLFIVIRITFETCSSSPMAFIT